ncbi:hypothetical protein VPH35_040236 [Triticum aestivum]
MPLPPQGLLQKPNFGPSLMWPSPTTSPSVHHRPHLGAAYTPKKNNLCAASSIPPTVLGSPGIPPSPPPARVGAALALSTWKGCHHRLLPPRQSPQALLGTPPPAVGSPHRSI